MTGGVWVVSDARGFAAREGRLWPGEPGDVAAGGAEVDRERVVARDRRLPDRDGRGFVVPVGDGEGVVRPAGEERRGDAQVPGGRAIDDGKEPAVAAPAGERRRPSTAWPLPSP